MATFAERACDIAETQVGVHEFGGRNRGGCERYQRPWGSWMVGEPWCGAFVSWVWEQAGMDGMHVASPSVSVMCAIARSRNLICSPRPGAAFCICGVHTGLLQYYMGGGVWKTIEGNSGDQVAWRQRSLGGLVIYAPPEIARGATQVAPPQVTWYYLEDLHQRGIREFGGWSSKKARNEQMAKKERELHRQLRPFMRRYPNRRTPYYFEDETKNERYYGGWKSKDARNDARKELQQKLGRRLRPFSVQRTLPRRAGADTSLGKTD
jgi:hypothetical protein